LGIEKLSKEYYQVTLGGSSSGDVDIGKIIGPAFSSAKIVDAIDNLVATYVNNRIDNERFLDTYRRIGQTPFRENLYADN
jgi:sulfite reductase (NADPH) hemoprotein beta-component